MNHVPLSQTASEIEIRVQLSCLRTLVLELIRRTEPSILIDGETPEAWLFRARKVALRQEIQKLSQSHPALATDLQKILADLEAS